MTSTGLAAKDGNLQEGDIILKVRTHARWHARSSHLPHIWVAENIPQMLKGLVLLEVNQAQRRLLRRPWNHFGFVPGCVTPAERGLERRTASPARPLPPRWVLSAADWEDPAETF